MKKVESFGTEDMEEVAIVGTELNCQRRINFTD